MTIAEDVASAFDALRVALPAQAKTLAFTNPTAAAVAGLFQATRRVPRDHDARGGATVEVEVEAQVLATALDVTTLHEDLTTISDGTSTWRLREQPGAPEGYLLTLRLWRAVDYDES